MTDAVKRYCIIAEPDSIGDGWGTLELVHPNGEWVKASDYAALQQQLEQAQGTVELLDGNLKRAESSLFEAWQATQPITDSGSITLAKVIFDIKHRAEHAEARVRELESYPNNRVACVNCKQPVEVDALNAIRCEACQRDIRKGWPL